MSTPTSAYSILEAEISGYVEDLKKATSDKQKTALMNLIASSRDALATRMKLDSEFFAKCMHHEFIF